MKLIFALIISIFAVMPLEAKSDACLAKSKEHFNEKEYTQAERTLLKCLQTDPKNPDMLISLAGVEMILGKFNNAEQNFKRALSQIGPKSQYRAYIYSRMGDIYMRRTNLKEAQKYYLCILLKFHCTQLKIYNFLFSAYNGKDFSKCFYFDIGGHHNY